MSTTKNLLVLATSLLSLNASALVCETQMIANNGNIVQSFLGEGVDTQNACRESRKDCSLELRLSQREGRRLQAKCVLIGIVDDYSGPTGPSYPAPPAPAQGHGNRELNQLEDTLQTGGWRARQYAAVELGKFASVRALELAIDATGDTDSDVRAAATTSVNQIINNIDFSYDSVAVMQSITPMLKNGTWTKRKTAAKILGMVQTAQAIIPLIDAMGDTDSDVRSAVANSLNQLMHEPDLKQVVKDNLDIIETFAKTGSWQQKQKAMQVIEVAAINKTIVLAVEKTGDSDSDVRAAAKKAMNAIFSNNNYLRLSKNVINQLESLYRNYSWQVRQAAIIALGETRNPYAKSVVLDALDDSDSDVRNAAKKALRKL